MNRVFVTGYGLITAFGRTWAENKEAFARGENAVRHMSEYVKYKDLDTHLAAPILDYTPPREWDRKQLRSLGRVSQYSVETAGAALDMSGLDRELIKDGRMGVAAGSSSGSTDAILSMAKMYMGEDNRDSGINANTYIKMMPHTIAANISLFYGLKGRLIPTSSACASASQAIGYAYESIKNGKIPLMLAGGGEELCVSQTFTFNFLYATSTKNDTPKLTPSPFDMNRDGLVVGEGAAFLVLESEKSMKARQAMPIAEVVGYGSTCDGTHITRPQSATMKEAMILALEDAKIEKEKISYINAHATATKWGDIAESIATNELFGSDVKISSLKSYLGHTLGACGGIESIACIEMLREGVFYPTINLKDIDPACAKLGYLREIESIKGDFSMNNNFAFGGVNTSLIFKRV